MAVSCRNTLLDHRSSQRCHLMRSLFPRHAGHDNIITARPSIGSEMPFVPSTPRFKNNRARADTRPVNLNRVRIRAKASAWGVNPPGWTGTIRPYPGLPGSTWAQFTSTVIRLTGGDYVAIKVVWDFLIEDLIAMLLLVKNSTSSKYLKNRMRAV